MYELVFLFPHLKSRLSDLGHVDFQPTLMTTATMISVFLLGTILKMGKWFVSEEGEEEFMTQCRIYAESGNPLQLSPPAPRRTFDRFWEFRSRIST
jgi:hypothetical protein